MRYKSTRGQDGSIRSFEDVVMEGLCSDNGLFVPLHIPQMSLLDIEKKPKIIFFTLARSFIDESEINNEDLRVIVTSSFVKFRSPEVVPCRKIEECWVLELFHGPTFAFKDIALQFLGNLFEYFLKRNKGTEKQTRITILAATSGDTGSAAIHGMSGKQGINTVIMFPNDKVTKVQELQMTTVVNPNVHCISLQGDFDDAQAIVKAAFSDVEFRNEVSLGAVNSINWARILAQISYYFYSWFKVTEHNAGITKVNFAVPTGNFGDILAGYYAKSMGLPIDKLVICTNKNNVLHRFLQSGVYKRIPAEESLAPSMDISVSSNFERYLYYLSGEDSSVLTQWMNEFQGRGQFQVPENLLSKARSDFLSHSSSDVEILSIMSSVHAQSSYLVCPHTATAIAAVHQHSLNADCTVVLATAHPMKFEDAVVKALPELTVERPKEMNDLFDLPVKSILLPNDCNVVKSFVKYVVN